MTTIQFAPYSSDIELAFYSSLASLKINHDRLDDSARKVLGLYELRPQDQPERSCRMQIHGNALTTNEVPSGYYRAEGIIKNFNTLEEYRSLDRSATIERAGRIIWDAINDGTIYSCPSLLASFTAISFADLKKYRFTYHFGFPALHSDPPWKSVAEHARLTPRETSSLVDTVNTWKYSVDARQHGFFLARRVRNTTPSSSTDHGDESSATSDTRESNVSTTPGASTNDSDGTDFTWAISSLSAFETGFFDNVPDEKDHFIAFVDPSNYPYNPGWMLRNLLVLVRQRWHLNKVQVLCYRDTHIRRDQPSSIILTLETPSSSIPANQDAKKNSGGPRPRTPQMPKVTGWERDANNKLMSRMVDLAEYMDPTKLADQAVDLNLKLIKWRIAPEIDLDVIKNTKCLLLGAGTLGSYVARNLLGWGVRTVTFVDSARVSFSNPVRQPLFDFKDCLQGGAAKAERAAEALQEIYPGVEANGHVLSVPMAGHPILEKEESRVKAEFEKLKKLVDEHDAIFLLLDTRESRWLPTVMGKAAGKIVLNAALGFESYVVMRHGSREHEAKSGGEEMGCYFCNDVVAPVDSLKDATLDQQCTVTRPGVAPIASALLVELLVSILQHPLRARAPAAAPTSIGLGPSTSGSQPLATAAGATAAAASQSGNIPSPSLSTSSSLSTVSTTTGAAADQKPFTHPLGLVPHQIRGFLSSFSNVVVAGQPYDCCSACGPAILKGYKEGGWEFVKRAINEKGWVEEVSGLKEVQRRAEEMAGAVEWDEEDEEGMGEMGEGELI
ncbi:hypothetical protein BDY21DRAFT_385748 [Lineolata rhizophorae]|uniref:Ubiquitin-like modifier-activating enzyme ATG7 n=1 Tax=Lineolata rhizophorae TaxID=578093 RepID=A0A6A6P1Z3_9PEZI|nr:hypothetical protein BDY21DRAFT_385748 [Lineolata rhizophorae]